MEICFKVSLKRMKNIVYKINILVCIILVCCNISYATALVPENELGHTNFAITNNLSTNSNIATISTLSTISITNAISNTKNITRGSSGGGAGSGNYTRQNIIDATSNSDYKDSLNNSIEVGNSNNVQDAENNDSIRINGRTSLDELKEAVGYTGDEDLSEMVDSAAVGNMLSDLMNELRPHLTDVISVDADGYYVFSSKEIINIIAKHPIKFLVAIYNYTVHMINETFKIATENAIVDVEVK